MSRIRGATAAFAGVLLVLAGCGGDSTGPRSLDSNGALQSLALGLGALAGPGGASAPFTDGSLGEIAPLLDHLDVTINGTSQSMFGVALLETFPPGTCQENLFPDPQFPAEPGVCTPPPPGLVFVLWQSHAANAPPEKLLVIGADVGTSNFDFFASPNPFPGIALYFEGLDNASISATGSLTTAVAATGQNCSLPLPPYAKSGVCHIATLNEQGTIAFESLSGNTASPANFNVTIPQQTLHGIWEEITETQPVTLSGGIIGFIRGR